MIDPEGRGSREELAPCRQIIILLLRSSVLGDVVTDVTARVQMVFLQ